MGGVGWLVVGAERGCADRRGWASIYDRSGILWVCGGSSGGGTRPFNPAQQGITGLCAQEKCVIARHKTAPDGIA